MCLSAQDQRQLIVVNLSDWNVQNGNIPEDSVFSVYVAKLPSPCTDTVPSWKFTILKMLLLEVRAGLAKVHFQFPHDVGDDFAPRPP